MKLRAKLRFNVFYSVFGTFTHKEVQIWFVFYETLHTIVFYIYYYVEMVLIENNSHMLENYVLSCIFKVFKAFLSLFRIN